MQTSIVILCCLLVVMATASNNYYGDRAYGRGGRYGYGFRRTTNGLETPYNNAGRQRGVNYLAEAVGASSGTAYYDDVPGTGNYFGGRYSRGGYHGQPHQGNSYHGNTYH